MTILVYEREWLTRSPDGNDHSKTMFMMADRLLEKKASISENLKIADFDPF